jgi:hypothetical protein
MDSRHPAGPDTDEARAGRAECLVGTFVVVAIDGLIELGLLLEEVAGRRLLEARLEKAG